MNMNTSMQSLFKSVGSTSLLSKDEEIILSKRIESGDMKARDLMIRSNIRLAISIAKKHVAKGLDFEDLVQESSIGLIKAVDRFDWRKGYKFSTYACWWIKQSIQAHVASQSASIRLPNHAKNTLWKMREIVQDYREQFGIDPSNEEIAAALGTTPETLQSIISCSATMLSLDAPVSSSDEGSKRTLTEVLADDDVENVESMIDRERLMRSMREVLSKLSPREEAVLRMRFGIANDDTIEGENNANA
jgi:RNA polymerase primary sigma factor